MSDTVTHLEQFASDFHQEVLRMSGDDAKLELREDALTELVLELLSEHNEADGAELCHFFNWLAD